MAPPKGLAPYPPWPCTGSVWEGLLGETHIFVSPEASCVPVRQVPSDREYNSWQWDVSEEANRSTWASPKRLRFDGRQVATCDGSVDRLGSWCTQWSQCCPYGPVHACRVAAFWSGAKQAIPLATRGNSCATAIGAQSRASQLHTCCTWLPSPWQRHLFI